MIWGIVPAAGRDSRLQPISCSKELLPVGATEREGRVEPRAVAEYIVERMIAAGAERICFVLGPEKTDILRHFGAGRGPVRFVYVVQEEAAGLCDALFQAADLVDQADEVLVGLPDTIWEPADGFSRLPPGPLSFLLFPVEEPQHFDAVICDQTGLVTEIEVKSPEAHTNWVWGAFRINGGTLHTLRRLWEGRTPRDEFFGTLVNAWLAEGGGANAARAGESYLDVGTIKGYRAAMAALATAEPAEAP